MLPLTDATASASGALDAFLQQLDAPGRRPATQADPLEALHHLGLLPEAEEEPVWQYMSGVDWFILLRGIATRNPRLGCVLASLRFAAEFGNANNTPEEPVGWALNARSTPTGGWQLQLPLDPAQAPRWYFSAEGQVATVRTAALQTGATEDGRATVYCHGADVRLGGPPAASLPQRCQRDTLALWSGILWRLLDCTTAHAAQRPVFRRTLADFPAIQARLSAAQARVLRAEELADCAARQWDPATAAHFRCEAEAIRIETQQICGGSGFMRESPYAQSLIWHEWCDEVLRQSWQQSEGLACHHADFRAQIDAAVRERLAPLFASVPHSALPLPLWAGVTHLS